MKVKITYTVDMQDVLGEVQRLFDESVSTMVKLCKEHETHKIEEDTLIESTKVVDDFRKKLYAVDLVLADMDGIIRSYVETKFPSAEESEERVLLNG